MIRALTSRVFRDREDAREQQGRGTVLMDVSPGCGVNGGKMMDGGGVADQQPRRPHLPDENSGSGEKV